ncbi:hypothetical protein JTE90_020554 [Oedothorax gibbosus]|uniref:Uncharacterized protein n=1 Tax=Oedothorax gibbosus TaxID=931172 RepID=A0AAV6VWE0_9ARAC|nr:hypothetical protein JTE90_020554 [Oedothorax gibbosus]
MLSDHQKAPGHLLWCWRGRNMEAGVSAWIIYPLPRIDDTLDCLRGAQYFSSMDLYSGYCQIEVDEDDREKTAFVTS